MIRTIEELYQLYPEPKGRALKKQLSRLDRHCQRFIELSPFLVIATGNASGFDASPRGGAAGFVKVVDDLTLMIPDAPGNNRLDSLKNIIETGRVGLLFFVPGVDETLRINGVAHLSVEESKLQLFATEQRVPKVVVEVTVEEAYFHCAKAIMRSQLWADESQRERSVLPTMGQMLQEQIGSSGAPETQEEMVARYKRDL